MRNHHVHSADPRHVSRVTSRDEWDAYINMLARVENRFDERRRERERAMRAEGRSYLRRLLDIN